MEPDVIYPPAGPADPPSYFIPSPHFFPYSPDHFVGFDPNRPPPPQPPQQQPPLQQHLHQQTMPPQLAHQDQPAAPQRRRAPIACTRCRKRKIACHTDDLVVEKRCKSCITANVHPDDCQFLRVGTNAPQDIPYTAFRVGAEAPSSAGPSHYHAGHAGHHQPDLIGIMHHQNSQLPLQHSQAQYAGQYSAGPVVPGQFPLSVGAGPTAQPGYPQPGQLAGYHQPNPHQHPHQHQHQHHHHHTLLPAQIANPAMWASNGQPRPAGWADPALPAAATDGSSTSSSSASSSSSSSSSASSAPVPANGVPYNPLFVPEPYQTWS